MGSITFNCKQALSILLTIAIVMMPFSAANALITVRDWGITNISKQGASVVINGAKSVVINGSNVSKTSTALLTPSAAAIAKALAAGVGVLALDAAVRALLGGVDYVLDPANNSISYTEQANATYSINAVSPGWSANQKFASHSQACQTYISIYNANIDNASLKFVSSNQNTCVVNQYDEDNNLLLSNYALPISVHTTSNNETKSFPLSTIAEQVISDAAGGNADAQTAIQAVAEDMLANDTATQAEVAQQLDENAKTPTSEAGKADSKTEQADAENAASSASASTGTETKTDFQLPIFCEYAPTVCEAAQFIINKPKIWAESIQSAYDDAVDYFKNDEPNLNNETEVDIPEPEAPNINTQIDFGGNCPATLYAPYSFFGISGQIEFSFEPVCKIADFIKPVVITISAFASAMIIAGIRTEDD